MNSRPGALTHHSLQNDYVAFSSTLNLEQTNLYLIGFDLHMVAPSVFQHCICILMVTFYVALSQLYN